MSSKDITLNEFVCSIPICQTEADLESILHIFGQTNCSFLAAPIRSGVWGIISSQKLLSLLLSWQRLPVAMVGHPKKTPHHSNRNFSTRKEFQDLIEPAIVYQSNTSLEEFLQSLKSLQNSNLQTNLDKHLIVNATGQLQGKLDKDKLLRYLGSRFEQNTTDSPRPASPIPWLSLLDNLAIPLKIETESEENYYVNECWQKSISQSKTKRLAQPQAWNVSVANWWMEKQLDTVKNNLGFSHPTHQAVLIEQNSNDSFCCLGDEYYSRHQQNVLSRETNLERLKTQQPSAVSSDNFHPQVDNSSLGIQIEKGIEWDYIRIPLTLNNEQLFKTPASEYWLVLAIKPSLLQQNNDELKSQFSTTESTVNQLLAVTSHELKSPLTGIVGLSNLLGSQKLGKLNQRQTLYIQLIQNSGQKLMAIVNDLLELTNLTTEKLELKPEAIDLKALLKELYHKAIAKLKAIDSTDSNLLISTSKLQLKIEPGQEIAIADRPRLSSIISHLMLETIQFSDIPSVATEVIVQNSGKKIAITVKNDTSSISKSYLDDDTHSVSQGMGLDLILAKYLAETLQGKINGNYSPNSCSFTLVLPQKESKSELSCLISSQTSADDNRPQKNLTILCLYPESEVIDAQAGNNNGLDFDLKNWAEQDWFNNSQPRSDYRHRVIEADGLEQAHTLARIWQLNAIVLDGYQIADSEEYLRSLQKSEYLSALPLITLDSKTTKAANRIEGLNVYPCLLPYECRSIEDLMQVIQIATGA